MTSGEETHSVRLVVAKIQYLDPMRLGPRDRGELRGSPHTAASWLAFGQEAIDTVDVAFRAEALTAKKLSRLRLEIG
jgi:hypothetical protein